jgi:hypothetical protein
MRQPVVITSLEEDLAEIGLSDSIKPKTESAAPEATPAAPAAATPAAEPDNVEEGKRVRAQVRVVGGKAKRVRTKRTSMAKKLANRSYYRKKKNVLKRKAGKASFQRRAARRDKIRSRLKRESVEFQAKVEGLLEDVEKTLTSLQAEQAPEKAESLKGFANLAIIAEMLAEAFLAFADADDEDIELTKFEEIALREMAATYAQVAEECADIAEALNAGTIAEGEDDLKEAFNAHVQSVIEGLDAYSDLTEDDDEDDEDDEDECEDCGESDCECDEGK